MLFDNLRQQVEATSKRYDERTNYRNNHELLIKQKKFLSVDTPDRIKKFLNRNGINPATAESFVINREKNLPEVEEAVGPVPEPNALERILGLSDLMGVSFLERGLQVAQSVCKIWVNISGGRPEGFGTGFLITPRLLMTNHHVLESAAIARKSQAEFNYQVGTDNTVQPSFTFALDPDTFYFSDKTLDYAIVAVAERTGNGKQLEEFGYNSLIEDEGKFILPQYLNIIQHPNGDPKQLCLRENQAIDLLESFVHYKTDTAPGSSGSPVFNDKWEVVALHHSGKWKTNANGDVLTVDNQVWKPSMGENRIQWISNEGVRISRIIKHVRTLNLNTVQKNLFNRTFTPSVLPQGKRETLPAISTPASNDLSATIDANGTATWTIPLRVSINLGNNAFINTGGATPGAGYNYLPAGGDQPATGTPAEILNAAKKEFLKREDVLSVRLGYVFSDGWVTDEKALMVTVRKKRSMQDLMDRNIPPLPETFMGMPIEVMNPTIEELFRLAIVAPSTTEMATVKFPDPNEIKYFPPANTPLVTVNENMRVIAHTSPDHGWPQLQQFISQTKKSLVIGMYDFGAPHIVEEIKKLKKKSSFKSLKLVIQSGESVGDGTKKDDLTDAEVIEAFSKTFGKKFETVYVKMGSKNGWVDRSYHIKVIVRDETAFWLSSGNLQSSNQPDADPLNETPQQRKWLEKYNREWHIIMENPKLAKVYQKYILHDLKENEKLQAEEAFLLPDILIPDIFIPAALEVQKPFTYFDPFDEKRKFKVTPILTPDNYLEKVIPMIKSANAEILIQNQTFNAPGENTESLTRLLDAILDKQSEGITVRVIFRAFNASDDMANLAGLINKGFKKNNIRLQKNCHTKGIIVDGKKVLVGSQNISNLGISNNRDASLLFDDQKLAQHYKKIFEHDWKNLAEQKVTGSEVAARVAGTETTPANMERISWKDYMELL